MNRWDLGEKELVAATAQTVKQLESALSEAVVRARERGLSWEQIASALKTARQSAWRRFKEANVKERADTKKRVCNFCGQPQHKVEHFVVAKTGASICGECIDLSSKIVGWSVVEKERSEK